jgi:DNA-binding HxlR family transcriptional regulator
MGKVSRSRAAAIRPGAQDRPARSITERFDRGDLFAEGCPSREVMKHVTSSWGVLVLVALRSGTHRFSELRRRVNGVSERMLAQTLQWLEGDGLVERRAFKVVPPHVEYSLTPMGREAADLVASLGDWIERNVVKMPVYNKEAYASPPPQDPGPRRPEKARASAR